MERIDIARVTVTLHEGLTGSKELNTPFAYTGDNAAKDASARIASWGNMFAQGSLAGLKCTAVVTYADGYDFAISMAAKCDDVPDIMKEITNEVCLYAGVSKPSHLNWAQVMQWRLNHLSEEDIAFAQNFLLSYRLN